MALHDKHYARNRETWLQNYIVRLMNSGEKIDDYFVDEQSFQLTEEKIKLIFKRTKKLNN